MNVTAAMRRAGRVRARTGSLGSLALATWCAACGGSGRSPNVAIQPDYNKESGRLERLRHDANGNGVAETTSYLDGGRITRIEVDLNEDGRLDRWEYYGSDQRLQKVGFSRSSDGHEDAWSYADESGTVVRIEMAAAPGERVTRTEFFDRGVLVRAEEDTNADGLVDKWETYDQGRLTRLAFSTMPGAPANALVYVADGSVRFEGASDASSAGLGSAR